MQSRTGGTFQNGESEKQVMPTMGNVEELSFDVMNLWYVSDARIRTKAAAEKAIAVAEWAKFGHSDALDHEPESDVLFIALHTCAYRASRKEHHAPIPWDERVQWANRWRAIREHIVERNLGLAYSMISQFNSRKLDEDDLLSEAMYALTRAVDRFNPWRMYRFSTYACNVIARALMRRGKREGVYRRLLPVQHDASFERPSTVPDLRTELYVERLHRALDMNLGELTDLESRILVQRFPTDRRGRLTFQKIGDIVGLSKERVRQIQNIALRKLRGVLSADSVLQ